MAKGPGDTNDYTKGGRDKWYTYLNKPLPFSGKPIKESILNVSKQSGIRPSLLFSSAMEEGMSELVDKPSTVSEAYHMWSEKNPKLSDQYPVDGFYTFGLDTFGDQYDTLVKKGYLPKDFNKKFQLFDAVNETGDKVRTAAFDNEESALLAKAASLRYEKDNVQNYAKKKGLKLSPKQLDFFTLSGYNTGEGNVRKMIDSYNEKGYLKDDTFLTDPSFKPASWSQPYTYVQRRLVNADNLEKEGYFEDGGSVKEEHKEAVKSVRDFYSSYLDSPKYTERLAKQRVGNSPLDTILDTSKTLNKRKDRFQTTYVYDSEDTSYPSFSADSVAPTIYMNQRADKDAYTQGYIPFPLNYDSVLAHEFSHAIGSYDPDAMLNKKEASEISKRNKLSKTDAKPLGKVPREHDLVPEESKADLDALRYMLWKDKIYDTSNSDFTEDVLKKAKDRYKNDYQLQRLFNYFDDKDLIWMMNNIAYNSPSKDSTSIAKSGKKVKFEDGGDPDKDQVHGPITYLNSYYNSPMFRQRAGRKADEFVNYANQQAAIYNPYVLEKDPLYDEVGSRNSNEVLNRMMNLPKEALKANVILSKPQAKRIGADLIQDVLPHEYSHFTRELSDKDEFAFAFAHKNPKVIKLRQEFVKDTSKNYNDTFSEWMKLKDESTHDLAPDEGYSDLNSLRYQMFRQGIYDTRKRPMTIEDLNKAKKDPWLNKQFNFKRLLKNYSPENIVRLNNEIAYNEPSNNNDMAYAKSGIHIKPSKRGTFTAAAKKHGKSVQEFASQVLANKGNYSPAMVKKANFARNAAKWKHEDGGNIPGDNFSVFDPNPFQQNLVNSTSNPLLGNTWNPTNVDRSTENDMHNTGNNDKSPANHNWQQYIAPGLAALDAILPRDRVRQPVVRPQTIYNQFAQGTGSQAIYEDGGNIPCLACGGKMANYGEAIQFYDPGTDYAIEYADAGASIPGATGMMYSHGDDSVSYIENRTGRGKAKDGKWIQKAVNPKHKGYCTPMTKSTCTPRRKALAKTFKKHHGFHEDGGYIPYYEEGQMYDLSNDEIQSLLDAGYDLEF